MARLHLHCHLDVQLAIRSATCQAGDVDYQLSDEIVRILRDEDLAEAATPFLAAHGTKDTTEESWLTPFRLPISSGPLNGILKALRERKERIRRARDVLRWATERPSWETILEIEAEVTPDDVRVAHPPPDLAPGDRVDRDPDVTAASLLILWARKLATCLQGYIDATDAEMDGAVRDLLDSLESAPGRVRRALIDAGKSVADFLPDPVRAELGSAIPAPAPAPTRDQSQGEAGHR
jgi:hypothetical protein